MSLEGHRPQGVTSYVDGRKPIEEIRIEFLGCAAAVADQKGRLVILGVAAAGHIGVEAFNAVGKAHAFQKFEGPIDRRRLGGFALQAERRDQVIGFQGSVRLKQKFEHTPAGRGQAFLRGVTTGFRFP